MTRAIAEARGLLVEWPSTDNAPRWLRNDDRRTRRPTGRVEYGYNCVQEIVSGTVIECGPGLSPSTRSRI